MWCGGFRVDAAGNCIEGTSTWKKPEREDDWKAYIDPGTGFKFSHRRPRAAVRALDAARSPACLRCCRRPQAAAAMSGAATNDGADCADDVVLRPCRSWGRQSTTCGAAASSSAAGGQGRPCAPSTRRRLCAPSTRREVLHVCHVCVSLAGSSVRAGEALAGVVAALGDAVPPLVAAWRDALARPEVNG